MNILVVDDSKIARQTLRRHFENGGYNVIEASSGEEALEVFQKEQIDLITLDVEMNGLDGFETCKRIRNQELSSSNKRIEAVVPIIFVTANDNISNRMKGFEAGATDFIFKKDTPLAIQQAAGRHLQPSVFFLDMKVLVAVEEKSLFKAVVIEALHTLRVSIDLCYTEANILELLSENPETYDLILLDSELPDALCIETLWKIRRELGLKEIPVIVFNDAGNPGDRIELYKAGADDYIEKPFLFEDLSTRVRQILELQQLTRQRQGMIRELERSNQALKEFSYVAAHDLRSPLLSLRWCAESLEPEGMSEMNNELVARMLTSCERMDNLITALLDYSRLGGTKGTLEFVELSSIIQTACNDLQYEITEKHGIVEIGALPKVLGNQGDLRRLFQNLLSNALKYQTPGATPRVEIGFDEICKTCEENPGNKQLFYRIHVRDNGIGFENSKANEIFNLFTRLVGRSQYEGSGIGLATCRQIAINHGGTVYCQSAPNEGATFSVELPIPRS